MVSVGHGQEAAQVSTVLPFPFKNSVQSFVLLCVFSPVSLLLFFGSHVVRSAFLDAFACST